MMDDNIVKFKRKVGARGEGLGVGLPPELIKFLEIESGDEVTLVGDTGKHGKFIAVFKEEPSSTKPEKVESFESK